MRNVTLNRPNADELATVGSIDSKPKDKAAAHRAVVLRNSWRRVDTTWQQWQEQLSEAMKERIWEDYPEDTPAGTLTALLEQLGIDSTFALDRKKWSDRPLPEQGGDRRSEEFQADIVRLKDSTHEPETQFGNSADYTVRRLRRDAPDLAERVIAGELSPNAAAIEAGFRKRKMQLPDDPTAAGRYLARRVDKDWLLAMVDEFMKALEA